MLPTIQSDNSLTIWRFLKKFDCFHSFLLWKLFPHDGAIYCPVIEITSEDDDFIVFWDFKRFSMINFSFKYELVSSSTVNTRLLKIHIEKSSIVSLLFQLLKINGNFRKCLFFHSKLPWVKIIVFWEEKSSISESDRICQKLTLHSQSESCEWVRKVDLDMYVGFFHSTHSTAFDHCVS